MLTNCITWLSTKRHPSPFLPPPSSGSRVVVFAEWVFDSTSLWRRRFLSSRLLRRVSSALSLQLGVDDPRRRSVAQWNRWDMKWFKIWLLMIHASSWLKETGETRNETKLEQKYQSERIHLNPSKIWEWIVYDLATGSGIDSTTLIFCLSKPQ